MNKELEIWEFAAERLKRGEPVVLLVVAESAGSSPGRQGFKMVVAADELAGSIGGGVMEVRLVELAKLKIKNKELTNNPEIVEQIHRQNVPHSSGMICSGWQKVILIKLGADDHARIRHIPRHLKEHRRFLHVTPQGLSVSPVGVLGNQSDINFKSKDDDFIYEERLTLYKNRLYIVGGGHCALALSEIAAKLDFHISLFDDRADLNTLAKNEFAHEKKIIESYEKIADFIPSGANSYVVVMTLGFKFDEIVIRKLFDRDFKYFGVLGSRAKMKTLLKTLEKEGFDKERLKKIRTPIGLKINSRTPEEIAVSIAAEMIAVKNS